MMLILLIKLTCYTIISKQSMSMVLINDPVLEISIYEPRHEISNNVVFVTSKASDQPAHTGSLIRAFTSPLNIL